MAVKIPEQIRYLAFAIAELAKFGPESLGDANDAGAGIVETAIRSRIHGLSESAAMEVLQEDCLIMEEWLFQTGSAASPAHYAYGFVRGATLYGGVGKLGNTSALCNDPSLVFSINLPCTARVR